uniref:Uncharacterized protein n=1 Tax=Ciona savignyi TaxID=51511 RepID=H2YX72_CIOSA
MGSKCTDECRKFGHSDLCWMPSPSTGQYFPSTDSGVTRGSSYPQPTFTQANPGHDFQRRLAAWQILIYQEIRPVRQQSSLIATQTARAHRLTACSRSRFTLP